jgi:hypothetical protein
MTEHKTYAVVCTVAAVGVLIVVLILRLVQS